MINKNIKKIEREKFLELIDEFNINLEKINACQMKIDKNINNAKSDFSVKSFYENNISGELVMCCVKLNFVMSRMRNIAYKIDD